MWGGVRWVGLRIPLFLLLLLVLVLGPDGSTTPDASSPSASLSAGLTAPTPPGPLELTDHSTNDIAFFARTLDSDGTAAHDISLVLASDAPAVERLMASEMRDIHRVRVQACDGTADEEEINDAIATDHYVLLSTGTFRAKEPIVLSTENGTLAGSGRSATVITKVCHTRGITVSASDACVRDLTVVGDGMTANERLIVFEGSGSWAENVRATGSRQYNVVFNRADNCRLVACESDSCVDSTANSGAVFVYAASVTITALYSHGNKNDAIYVYNTESDALMVERCLSVGDKGLAKPIPGRGTGVRQAHGPISIKGCLVKDSTNMAIDGSGLPGFESPLSVEGCTFINTAGNAIDGGGGYGWQIKGNTIVGVNLGDTDVEGYGITNCSRAVIADNHIEACWRAGIALCNNSDCVVSGNTILDCNLTEHFSGEGPADAAIYLWATGPGHACKGNVVINNTIIDNQAGEVRTLASGASSGQNAVVYPGSQDFFPNQCVLIAEGHHTEYGLVDYCTFSPPNTTVYLQANLSNSYTAAATVSGAQTQVNGIAECEVDSARPRTTALSGTGSRA